MICNNNYSNIYLCNVGTYNFFLIKRVIITIYTLVFVQ